MKFIIQTINNKVLHDFSFTLRESIRYRNWYYNNDDDVIIYTDNEPVYIEHTVPVGSVEFVSNYLRKYHNITPKPINVPKELYSFTNREVFVGDQNTQVDGNIFCKSHDVIKRFSGVIDDTARLDGGVYQFSETINIDSEYRCFVFQNELVGLQNYSGDFCLFPDISRIRSMIDAYQESAPVAYTLDVGINSEDTFVIEVHDFFSCGLYGFSDLNLLPLMFYRWFKEYISKR